MPSGKGPCSKCAEAPSAGVTAPGARGSAAPKGVAPGWIGTCCFQRSKGGFAGVVGGTSGYKNQVTQVLDLYRGDTIVINIP